MTEEIYGLAAPLTAMESMASLRRQLERGAVPTATAENFIRAALEDAEKVRAHLDEEKRDAA